MEIEEAIRWFEYEMACGNCSHDFHKRNAYEYAIKTFIEKMESEKNEPLTKDEILRMNDDPVFVVPNNSKWKPLWCIVYSNAAYFGGADFTFFKKTLYASDGEYGWIAYRHPTK